MRNPALIAMAVLCSVATACSPKDTEKKEEWPRLSINVGRVLQPGDEAYCDRAIRTHAEAVTMLVNQRACTDKAIAALISFAHSNADAMSDLGATYYMRAQWKDQPADLLLAFDASQHATNAKPQPKHAKFNLSLIEKALGVGNFSPSERITPARRHGELYDDLAKARERADIAALDPLEREARRRHDLNLTASVLSTRGYLLFYQSRYLESLNQYEKALAIYQSMHDREGAASMHVRLIGGRRVLGQYDKAWRETLETCRNIGDLSSLQERTLLFGEAAELVNAMGHPRAGILYANTAIRMVQRELSENPPREPDDLTTVQRFLAIARRWRAECELHAGQLDAALADLSEAARLNAKEPAQYRQALEARIKEIQAQAELRVNPASAIPTFTEALALSKDLEYRSFRASLYTQRAEAQRRSGNATGSEQDLRAALAELNGEESNLLKEREPGKDEEILWSSYFSRFQETYHALIRQLIESNRADEAFAYADRARAFEPLNLALKLTSATATTIDVKGVQQLLPPGTFLIEYTILEDRTYAWVITHDAWQVVTIDVPQQKIDRWSETLQRAAATHDFHLFEPALLAAYDALLTKPRAAIAQMPKSTNPRLVIVPDGAMYGIPFSALRNSSTQRYLVEDAPVEMAGSAALYAMSVHRDRELPRDVSALLMGNPTSAEPLPRAEDEVRKIEPLYTPHAVVRIGDQATADEFLHRAANSAIVHIAAHAIVDRNAPSHSSLLFASGPLDAAQILARLDPGRTRLVVLSACSSAGGLPVGPEGVGPLVRPLIAKRIPAVIGSLWDVDDATAEPLLVSFHQHYRKGSDAAVAMQLAQIELLRNPNSGLQSVLAWAPFQVIGHGTSPFAASR